MDKLTVGDVAKQMWLNFCDPTRKYRIMAENLLSLDTSFEHFSENKREKMSPPNNNLASDHRTQNKLLDEALRLLKWAADDFYNHGISNDNWRGEYQNFLYYDVADHRNKESK